MKRANGFVLKFRYRCYLFQLILHLFMICVCEAFNMQSNIHVWAEYRKIMRSMKYWWVRVSNCCVTAQMVNLPHAGNICGHEHRFVINLTKQETTKHQQLLIFPLHCGWKNAQHQKDFASFLSFISSSNIFIYNDPCVRFYCFFFVCLWIFWPSFPLWFERGKVNLQKEMKGLDLFEMKYVIFSHFKLIVGKNSK